MLERFNLLLSSFDISIRELTLNYKETKTYTTLTWMIQMFTFFITTFELHPLLTLPFLTTYRKTIISCTGKNDSYFGIFVYKQRQYYIYNNMFINNQNPNYCSKLFNSPDIESVNIVLSITSLSKHKFISHRVWISLLCTGEYKYILVYLFGKKSKH